MTEQEAPKLVGHTAREIFSTKYEPPSWIIQDLVARGAITTNAGFVGSGKTPIALRAARAVRRGEMFLGRGTVIPRSVPVAYLTEESRWTFNEAMHHANLDGDDDDLIVYYWDENSKVPYGDAVFQAAESVAGGLLLVDTAFFWSGVHALGAENDPGQMNEVYRPLVEAAAAFGCGIWVNAHTVKGFDRWDDDDADISAVRGSGAVVANSSVILLYKKMAADPTSNTRFFRIGRSRFGVSGDRDTYVRMDDDGRLETVSRVFLDLEREMREVDKMVALVTELHERNGGRVTQADITKAWKGDVKRISPLLKDAESVGQIRREGTGKRGSAFNYSPCPYVSMENGDSQSSILNLHGESWSNGETSPDGQVSPSEEAERTVNAVLKRRDGAS